MPEGKWKRGRINLVQRRKVMGGKQNSISESNTDIDLQGYTGTCTVLKTTVVSINYKGSSF